MRLEFEQGSPQWHEWRAGGIGGSDSASVMGENPWRTSLQLWEEKTGRSQGFKGNAASRRGNELEPEARMTYNLRQADNMIPACYQHDEYDFLRVSLDGINESEDIILEIKCSGTKVHEKVIATKTPPKYYYAQMQKCMLVTGATLTRYMTYNPDHPTTFFILDVPRDEKYIAKLLKAEIEFWNLITNDVAPQCETKDYIMISDQGFEDALLNYHHFNGIVTQMRARVKEAEKHEKLAKQAVLDFGDGGNIMGMNGKVTQITRKGGLNTDRLAAEFKLKDEDLDRFRNPEVNFWKITKIKGE